MNYSLQRYVRSWKRGLKRRAFKMRDNMIVILKIVVFLLFWNIALGLGLHLKSRKGIIPKSTSTYWVFPGLAIGNMTCPAFRSPLYGVETCFTESPGQYPLQPIQWVGGIPSHLARDRIRIEEVISAQEVVSPPNEESL
jgi:hypothetical protein